MLVGQAVALESLEALEALAIMLSSPLGLISLALALCSAVSRTAIAGAYARWPDGGARGAGGAGAHAQQFNR